MLYFNRIDVSEGIDVNTNLGGVGGGRGVSGVILLPPVDFPLITQKRITQKISLEISMTNLVILTCSNLQLLEKAQTGVFSISEYLVNPF